MSIDPRRSAVTLLAIWVAAGALGGALATLLAIAGLGVMVNGVNESPGPLNLPFDLRVLAYFGTLAAIASLFQALVLMVVAPRKRAALLWLPATALAASIVFWLLQNLVFDFSLSSWFTALPEGTASVLLAAAFGATFALALGLAQGLVVALITERKIAAAVWVVALLLSTYVAHTYGPSGIGASLITSNALSYGAGAAVTGLALVLILRIGRIDRARGPGLAARSLQVPTP